MINCLVIDDETEALAELSSYIENIPKLNLLKTFDKPLKALEYIRSNQPVDLIFIDVDMPVLSGIELAGLVRDKTRKLIFTTSHSKYAVDAFKVDADDFLLKPFGFSDFIRVVEKSFPAYEILTDNIRKDQNGYLYIKDKENGLKLVKVFVQDIIAIESLLNYVRVHTTDSKLVTHLSLKEVKKVLDDYSQFVQLHRSFIISKDHISLVHGNMLTMTNGAKFTIGESYRDNLNEFLQSKILKPASKK
ncbi:LytR/AlgR family response regulator transcription factor [Pedobacter sp. N23S346]|uniref:LytR/AlgR family response regulator transcription factor n=1 Tax=Pedobacter sp. N23S346 TaxID=3402750 RepID=UPI003ACBF974